MTTCVFCDIIHRRDPLDTITTWTDAIAFTPLNPVTPGHILIVPTVHVTDFADNPDVSAATMRRAAQFTARVAPNDWNIITSLGPSATQTIHHLHLHLIPRRPGDGLALPWTNQPPHHQQ